MNLPSVRADAQLQAAFKSLGGLTEVHDDDGRVIGWLLPGVPREHLRAYLKALAEYDPEEIRRRKDEARGERGYTLQEILQELQSTDSPSCVTR